MTLTEVMPGDNASVARELDDKTRTFVCPHCGKPAQANVRGTAVWNGRGPDGDIHDPPTEWALVQCGRCRIPSVQVREDFGDGFDRDEPGIVYPAPPRLSYSIPQSLRDAWSEARTCFDAKAYTACVVMVRRGLEATCVDQGVKKGTLEKRLGKLRDTGVIDGTLAEWADVLRLAGNSGAHYGDVVTRDDAEDALAFGEALLEHIYVLRKRFEEFRIRVDA